MYSVRTINRRYPLGTGWQGRAGFSSSGQSLTPTLAWASQGDVVLQSDHVIETLTKTALSADRVNNININQGR